MSNANNKFQQNLITGDKKTKELLERYGVEGYSHGRTDRGSEYRGAEEVRKDLSRAMASDYDTRRSLEAASLSGDKKAKKLIDKGFDSPKGIYKTQEYFDKAADEQGYKNFNSTNDYMSMTDHFVKQDRAKQTAAYDKTYAKTTDLNSLKEKLMAEATDKAAGTPIEPSDRMAAVEDRLEGAAGNSPPSLFDKDNADPAKADDQKDAAKNFLNDYKLDVAKGANIKSDIKTGLSNAARHVRDTYGR